MGKYNCEKCGKEFTLKTLYTKHNSKKNPCIIENNIKDNMINIINSTPENMIVNNLNNVDNIEIINDNKLVKNISTKKIQISKPILKWVGGKTQIIDRMVAGEY